MNRLPAFCVLDFVKQMPEGVQVSPKTLRKQKNKEQPKGYSLFLVRVARLAGVLRTACKQSYCMSLVSPPRRTDTRWTISFKSR